MSQQPLHQFAPVTSNEMKVMAAFAHMTASMVMSQFTMAYIANAFSGEPPESLTSFILNVKGFAALLAHICGFAAIDSGCALHEACFAI